MKNKFGLENNLIISTKQTIDELLKYKNPADLISVYNFYYYTAKWQKTNQPKATTNFVAKGLKMGPKRVRKAKQELINIGLIEEVKITSKTGRVTGWYIKLNYILSQENHPVHYPPCGESHPVENGQPNALSADSLNALSAVNEMPASPSATPAVFNLKEEITKLKESKQRHIQLIGEFLEEKNVQLESAEQLKLAIGRHLRAAVKLAKFSDKRIAWASELAARQFPEMWTLETLTKLLTK